MWRLTEGWRDSQHMLGSYLGSPWSSAGTALAALRLPQHADTLAPGDKIQIGVFRHDKGETSAPLLTHVKSVARQILILSWRLTRNELGGTGTITS